MIRTRAMIRNNDKKSRFQIAGFVSGMMLYAALIAFAALADLMV